MTLRPGNSFSSTKKPEVPNTLSEDRGFAFSTKIKNLFELSKPDFQFEICHGHLP